MSKRKLEEQHRERSKISRVRKQFEKLVEIEGVNTQEDEEFDRVDQAGSSKDQHRTQEEELVSIFGFDDIIKEDIVSSDSEHLVSDTGSFHEDFDLSENEFTPDMVSKNRFTEKLVDWALENKITYSALKGLLRLLKTEDFEKSELPKDPRTLLKIASTKVKTVAVSGGEYWHYGLIKILRTLEEYNVELPDSLDFTINADGVQPHKKGKTQLWPILATLKNFKFSPFVIGIWEGISKPSNSDFLEAFVEEMAFLINEGFLLKIGKTNCVSLEKLSCDAPAMALVKGTKGHTGYFCCGSCTIKGEYFAESGNIGFCEVDCSPRTNENFRDFYGERNFLDAKYVDHHLSDQPTPILRVPGFDIIAGAPRDPMHLIFLGVDKKTLSFWVNKPTINRAGKLSSLQISKINSALREVSACYPRDFNRKPTSILDYNNWKATEHRSFLLYTFFLVLEGIVDFPIVNHFRLLSVSIYILSSSEHHHIFAEIYGKGYCSYNIHNLLHLADDCRKFGNLNEFDCFEFENKLGGIIKLLSSGYKSVQQASKRSSLRFELEASQYNHKMKSIELEIDISRHSEFGYSRISFENEKGSFFLEGFSNDQYFLTTSPHQIVSFYYADLNKKMYGKVIKNKWQCNQMLLNSEILYIFSSDGVESETFNTFEKKDVFSKLFRVKVGNKIMFIPLLHTLNKNNK